MIALAATYALLAFLAIIAVGLSALIVVAWVDQVKSKRQPQDSLILGTMTVLIVIGVSLVGIIWLAKEMGL